ncbi:hypothetical protein ACFPC0_11010 [Streptomyces andamanensis]|uniref:Uncharacterized protein n=1 Tax=Streptomyces andamanensis TaxID=1565035 RepID=A0ABV8TCK8_9ACTN
MFNVVVLDNNLPKKIGDSLYLPFVPQPPLTIVHDGDEWNVVRSVVELPQPGQQAGPLEASVYVQRVGYEPPVQTKGYEIALFGPDGANIGDPFILTQIPDPAFSIMHVNDEYRIEKVTVHMPDPGAEYVPLALDVTPVSQD